MYLGSSFRSEPSTLVVLLVLLVFLQVFLFLHPKRSKTNYRTTPKNLHQTQPQAALRSKEQSPQVDLCIQSNNNFIFQSNARASRGAGMRL